MSARETVTGSCSASVPPSAFKSTSDWTLLVWRTGEHLVRSPGLYREREAHTPAMVLWYLYSICDLCVVSGVFQSLNTTHEPKWPSTRSLQRTTLLPAFILRVQCSLTQDADPLASAFLLYLTQSHSCSTVMACVAWMSRCSHISK